MYLAANTCPDIAYVVDQAAKFSQNPKNTHAQSIKRNLRYSKKLRHLDAPRWVFNAVLLYRF